MPSWGELIQAMATEIDYLCGDKLVADDYLKISQIFIRNVVKWSTKISARTIYSQGQANHVHDNIFDLQPAQILTTNYDTILEETAMKK